MGHSQMDLDWGEGVLYILFNFYYVNVVLMIVIEVI